MPTTVKRQYKSRRREEQAAETRTRILRAAHDLFASQGYGRTTIVEIAERAGVAAETVYGAFHNKPTLLRRAWYLTFRGDEVDVPLYERAEMQAIVAEPDLATRIRKHAAFCTANHRRIAPLYMALIGASAIEQDAAKLLDWFRDRCLDVATKYAKAAARTGQLAVSEQACRDLVFAFLDGVLWQRLVIDLGWTDARYADWLGELWIAQLVKPRHNRRSSRRPRRTGGVNG
jgi:AcrR family transcriptional regulator